MEALRYRVLITVYVRDLCFRKGELVTLNDMGPYAFVLLHHGLAVAATCQAAEQAA
jgi:hypothetical protein